MKSQSEYIEKMKANLDHLDAQIDLHKAKADEATADAKIKYQNKIDELKEQREEAKEWLDNVSDASADAWDSVSGGFADAYKKIKKALS